MKLPAKFRWFFAIGILWFLGIAAWLIYDRFAPIDYSKEEEPFCSMAMPIRSAWGDIWMDGGSVSVRVTDNKGRGHDFILMYDHLKPEAPYTRAFHGTWVSNEIRTKGIAMKDSERARVLAIRLLAEFADTRNDSVSRALSTLKDGRRSLPAQLLEKAKSSLKP